MCTSVLMLCHHLDYVYKQWPLRTSILNYPDFCNLHHLKFILPCFNTSLLLNVLEKCHVLQVLLIQSSKVCFI